MDENEAASDLSKPEQPSESDCCNSGCTTCVFDLYEIRLAEWMKQDKVNLRNSNVICDLLSDTKFKPFILLQKFKVNPNVYLFRFQPYKLKISTANEQLEQNISGILRYRPGQHFVVKTNKDYLNKFAVEDNSEHDVKEATDILGTNIDVLNNSVLKGEDESINTKTSKPSFITRAYTPITLASEEVNCAFNIVVKLYKNGLMSNYFSKLNVANITLFRGPFGDFNYTPNSYRSILMMCIGTGIAPMYAVAKQILNNESDETLIKLFYGCRCVADIIMRDEITSMTSYWNFSVKFFISNCELNFTKKFGEQFIFSRICESEIVKEFSVNNDQLYLICGTEEFSKDISDIVQNHGVDNKSIHVF